MEREGCQWPWTGNEQRVDDLRAIRMMFIRGRGKRSHEVSDEWSLRLAVQQGLLSRCEASPAGTRSVPRRFSTTTK